MNGARPFGAVRRWIAALLTIFAVSAIGVPAAKADVLDDLKTKAEQCYDAAVSVGDAAATTLAKAPGISACIAEMGTANAGGAVMLGVISALYIAGEFNTQDQCNALLASAIAKALGAMLAQSPDLQSALADLVSFFGGNGEKAVEQLINYAASEAVAAMSTSGDLAPLFGALSCGCTIVGGLAEIGTAIVEAKEDSKACLGPIGEAITWAEDKAGWLWDHTIGWALDASNASADLSGGFTVDPGRICPVGVTWTGGDMPVTLIYAQLNAGRTIWPDNAIALFPMSNMCVCRAGHCRRCSRSGKRSLRPANARLTKSAMRPTNASTAAGPTNTSTGPRAFAMPIAQEARSTASARISRAARSQSAPIHATIPKLFMTTANAKSAAPLSCGCSRNGSRRPERNVSACAPGTAPTSDGLQCVSVCGAGDWLQWVGDGTPTGGSCERQCPAGMRFWVEYKGEVQQIKHCEPCAEGTSLNPNTNQCVACAAGAQWHPTGFAGDTGPVCMCPVGTVPQSGACQACPAGQRPKLNGNDWVCEACPAGNCNVERTAQSVCVDANGAFNPSTRECKLCGDKARTMGTFCVPNAPVGPSLAAAIRRAADRPVTPPSAGATALAACQGNTVRELSTGECRPCAEGTRALGGRCVSQRPSTPPTSLSGTATTPVTVGLLETCNDNSVRDPVSMRCVPCGRGAVVVRGACVPLARYASLGEPTRLPYGRISYAPRDAGSCPRGTYRSGDYCVAEALPEGQTARSLCEPRGPAMIFSGRVAAGCIACAAGSRPNNLRTACAPAPREPRRIQAVLAPAQRAVTPTRPTRAAEPARPQTRRPAAASTTPAGPRPRLRHPATVYRA